MRRDAPDVCQVNVPASTIESARAAISGYYAFTGRAGWGAPLSDPSEIADTVAMYQEFGADELVLYCYAEDPDQIEMLSDLAH